VTSYRVVVGEQSGVYTQTYIAGTTRTVTVSTLVRGRTYYFAVAARSTNGMESLLSRELVYTATNSVPKALAQSATTLEDQPLALVLAGTDVDADPLTFAVATPPAHGTLAGTPPNLTYRPAANYAGADSFSFSASDGLASSSATVAITVVAQNDAPTATAARLSTPEDQPLAVRLAGADVDGNPLSYVITTLPTRGTLSGTAPNLTYTPNLNFNGTDAFAFKVSDGSLSSAPASVDITTVAVNDPPVATASSWSLAMNSSVAFRLAGTDTENSPLTYAIVTAPTNGTVTGTAPNLTYSPRAGFSGTDQLRFTVSDGTNVSASALATFRVLGVPAITVAVEQASAVEQPTQSGRVRFTRTPGTNGALVVVFRLLGTATLFADYWTGSQDVVDSVTIPDGAASATWSCTPYVDGIAEPAETVIVTLATNASYTIGAPSSGTITITDAPPAGPASVASSPALAPFSAASAAPQRSGLQVEPLGAGVRRPAMRLRADAIPERSHALQASTDLERWVTLAQTAPGEALDHLDSDTAADGQRFYRLVTREPSSVSR
jgi:hypothetical protein